jgi:hypothetical protein
MIMCPNQHLKETTVNSPKFHAIWSEQCEAAEEIKLRYGLQAAFDYLVSEKLPNFAEAATRDGSRPLGSPRSLSDNNMPAEMAWPFFAIQDVTRSGLAVAAP